MGEDEPRDSRSVTRKQDRAPGEPPRTGPREGETRQQQGETELEQDERGEDAEQVADASLDALRTGQAPGNRDGDAPEEDFDGDEAGRLDRND